MPATKALTLKAVSGLLQNRGSAKGQKPLLESSFFPSITTLLLLLPMSLQKCTASHGKITMILCFSTALEENVQEAHNSAGEAYTWHYIFFRNQQGSTSLVYLYNYRTNITGWKMQVLRLMVALLTPVPILLWYPG